MFLINQVYDLVFSDSTIAHAIKKGLLLPSRPIASKIVWLYTFKKNVPSNNTIGKAFANVPSATPGRMNNRWNLPSAVVCSSVRRALVD
jgi:hypothetical protein